MEAQIRGKKLGQSWILGILLSTQSHLNHIPTDLRPIFSQISPNCLLWGFSEVLEGRWESEEGEGRRESCEGETGLCATFASAKSRSLEMADAQGAKNPSSHTVSVFSRSAWYNGKKLKEWITCLAGPLPQASLGGKMVLCWVQTSPLSLHSRAVLSKWPSLRVPTYKPGVLLPVARDP